MTPNIIISFDLNKLGDEGRDKLFKIERIFRDIGVTFDTGAGFGNRDWCWDFSLKGPVSINLVNKVEEHAEKKDNND